MKQIGVRANMPAVLSKPCKVTALCLHQDDVIHALLLKCKPDLRVAKTFHKNNCRVVSYELLKLHQWFYENCRMVMNQEKSQCLADHFVKGSYPKKRELRLLCQYYDTMFKALDR